MFCQSCGKPLAPGAKFCPACGAGIAEANSTNAPAPSVAPERSVAAPNGSVPLKRPLSAWHGVLIGGGILLFFLVLAAILGESAGPLIGLAVLGTSVWAFIDSYQIRRRYKAKDTTPQPLGLFLFMLLLWIIFFPIYLVQRSRVLARFGRSEDFQPPSNQQPTSEAATGGSGQSAGRRSAASKWVAPALAVLVIVDGAFNPNVSATMKRHMNADASWADVVKSLFDFSSAAAGQAPIWQTTEAQLAAANTTAGTLTPQIATDGPKPSAPAVEDDSAVISVVKNGVLADYNTTTVGKAFEGTFQNQKWTSFVSPKGVTVVQFDGTITALKLTEQGFVEFDGIYK